MKELCTFSLFDTEYKSSQPSHFLFVNFLHVFLNRFKLSIKLIPKSKSVVTKYFLGHISIFCKLLYQIPTKSIIKSKNVFHKCVLEFNFASIFKSRLFIFSKKVKIVVAFCACIMYIYMYSFSMYLYFSLLGNYISTINKRILLDLKDF